MRSDAILTSDGLQSALKRSLVFGVIHLAQRFNYLLRGSGKSTAHPSILITLREQAYTLSVGICFRDLPA